MTRTLIIGYGNIYRADDGVAFHVINELRQHLGHPPLQEGETGMGELGRDVDTLFLTQLVPELLDVACQYTRVVFVDSHVNENVDALHCEPIIPEFTPTMLTHHMTPETFLALLKSLYRCEVYGILVSIRGYDFDFSPKLSFETESLIKPAVEYIIQFLKSP